MKAPNSSCLSLINFIPTFYVPLSDFGGGSQSQACTGGLEQGRQRGTGRLVGGHCDAGRNWDNLAFQDVSPIKNGDFPLSC